MNRDVRDVTHYTLEESIECSDGFGVKIFVRRPSGVMQLLANLDDKVKDKDYWTDKGRESLVLARMRDECERLIRLQAARLDPSVAAHHKVLRDEFIQAFTDAGITAIYVEETTNGYSRPDDTEATLRQPWYIVTTPFGRITLGWCRHVISVEWKDSERELFNGKDLKGNGVGSGDGSDGYTATCWETGCHCYGYSKLTMVLKQLAESVKL